MTTAIRRTLHEQSPRESGIDTLCSSMTSKPREPGLPVKVGNDHMGSPWALGRGPVPWQYCTVVRALLALWPLC